MRLINKIIESVGRKEMGKNIESNVGQIEILAIVNDLPLPSVGKKIRFNNY